jgi:hypothetical protein
MKHFVSRCGAQLAPTPPFLNGTLILMLTRGPSCLVDVLTVSVCSIATTRMHIVHPSPAYYAGHLANLFGPVPCALTVQTLIAVATLAM